MLLQTLLNHRIKHLNDVIVDKYFVLFFSNKNNKNPIKIVCFMITIWDGYYLFLFDCNIVIYYDFVNEIIEGINSLIFLFCNTYINLLSDTHDTLEL